MKVVGLITEYNPFHNGHLYHITQAKKQTGADYAVIVMSGDYVQRGEPAIIDKYKRTQMGLLNGGDLVIELPVLYACASAEYFASGAIALLDKLGIIDYVCFGSECADVKLLAVIAKIFLDEPEEFRNILKVYLKTGISFPTARAKALLDYSASINVFDHVDSQMLEETLSSPNNILGIEYIKALLRRKSNMKPYALKRIVAGYHDTKLITENTIGSATAIRYAITEFPTLKDVVNQIPHSVSIILDEEYLKTFPIVEDDFSAILNYKLITSIGTLSEYVDVTEHLSDRIKNSLDKFDSFSGFCSILNSKHMTNTRIHRALLHILLGIKKNALKRSVDGDYIMYFRVLGFRKSSAELLRCIKHESSIPIITKLADAESLLSPEGWDMLSQDILCSQIYHTIVTDKYHSSLYNEFRQKIIIV